MPLNENEHQKITNWLAARFPGGLVCPLCHGDKWETNKTAGLITESTVFVASCKHCGHILLFSPELIKAPLDEPSDVSSIPHNDVVANRSPRSE